MNEMWYALTSLESLKLTAAHLVLVYYKIKLQRKIKRSKLEKYLHIEGQLTLLFSDLILKRGAWKWILTLNSERNQLKYLESYMLLTVWYGWQIIMPLMHVVRGPIPRPM